VAEDDAKVAAAFHGAGRGQVECGARGVQEEVGGEGGKSGDRWGRQLAGMDEDDGPAPVEQVHANAAASGITLDSDTLAAIDEALGNAPVTEPTLAPFARPGVLHR
jgi:hypothetical protein